MEKQHINLIFLASVGEYMLVTDVSEALIIGKTKSAILKNEKYIFWCFPAISGASV